MAILPVVQFPAEVLSKRTLDVKKITDVERKLVKDMIDTMYAEQGVGLAANQVGIAKQIFVASADQVRGQEIVCINPKIIQKEGTIKEFEGCLSVREVYEPVKRFKKVTIQAMDLDGNIVELKGEGLLSRIFQHEIDHLNGTLFIDRLGLLKTNRIKKKLLKSPRIR